MHPPASAPLDSTPPGPQAKKPAWPARTEKKVCSGTVAVYGVVTISLTLIIVSLYYELLPQDYPPIETYLGTRVEKTDNGDWQINITYGNKTVSSLTLQISNLTGGIIFKLPFESIKNPTGNPDAAYNDTNGNDRVDPGDTILLKASGGHVQSGFHVRLLMGDYIVGVVKELP